MNKFLAFVPLLFFLSCRLPDKWVAGAYVNKEGDTLRLKNNRGFRVEMVNPDTVEKKQLKFTSGKWHTEKRKLYLTIATESMGPYWGCVPMKVSIRHLKRPVECTEGGGGDKMSFHKVKVKKPKVKKEKKKKKDPLAE